MGVITSPDGDRPATRRRTPRPRSRFIVKRVKLTMGKQGTTGEAQAAHNLRLGRAGMIRAISVRYSAAANASGVVTIKAESSAGATLFTTGATATATTNAATGVLLPVATDAVNQSNSTQADQNGLFFARGLYLTYTLATAADTATVDLLIDTAFVYHKVSIPVVGADGSAAGGDTFNFGRPGILRAVRLSASAGSTADLTIAVDADVNGMSTDGTGTFSTTAFTATNYGTSGVASAAGTAVPAAISVAGLDEANGAVTTVAASGIPFLHGLKAAIAQANTVDVPVLEYWIEV